MSDGDYCMHTARRYWGSETYCYDRAVLFEIACDTYPFLRGSEELVIIISPTTETCMEYSVMKLSS
jgi:hypothetical protein